MHMIAFTDPHYLRGECIGSAIHDRANPRALSHFFSSDVCHSELSHHCMCNVCFSASKSLAENYFSDGGKAFSPTSLSKISFLRQGLGPLLDLFLEVLSTARILTFSLFMLPLQECCECDICLTTYRYLPGGFDTFPRR